MSTHSNDCVSREGVIYTVTHAVTRAKCALFRAKSLNTGNVWFSGWYLLSVSHSLLYDANKGLLFNAEMAQWGQPDGYPQRLKAI